MKTLLLTVISTLGLASVALAAPPLPYEAKAKHMGVVTCQSSLCHGSIVSWKSSNVLQNEYVTWSRADPHALKAAQVLMNDQSKKIAANLRLKEPAHQAKICVDCHGHNPPKERRGEQFSAGDGVSCEACHGPAEKWLATHVQPDATHADNVKNGLYPTGDPVALARLCLSCHFGNKDKFVTHRIMGAGHPRITFELDTFTLTQPPHFVPDADWVKRKGSWDSVRLWAIGQALAAQEQLDVFSDAKRGRDRLFPELVVFDCHACHHPMSEKRWRPATGPQPGVVRFNDANLIMLRQIVRRVDPAASANFNDRVRKLHEAVAGDGEAAVAHRAAQAVREAIDLLIPKLAKRSFNDADMRAILASLAEEGQSGGFRDFAGAEQSAMAVGSVLNYLARRGALKDVKAANAALDRLFKSISDDEKYQPERFQAAIAAVRQLAQP